VEKKTKQLFIVNLCASASLREVAYFFTPSPALATSFSPWSQGEAGGRDLQGDVQLDSSATI
jgi:hypothetical protein